MTRSMARALDILMVTQPVEGGVHEHVLRLARGLRDRGHRVTLCAPLEQAREPLGLDVERLAMTRTVSPGRDAAAAAGLARLVRRRRPDVVHAHSSKAGAVARLARLASPRTPLVYTPHGYAFAGFFEREAERTAYRAVERALSPLASRVLCVCEAERRLAQSIGAASRTRVVHNGVDVEREGEPHPALADLRERGPVIGVLAGLRLGKGLETAVDAMATVAKAHPAATLAIAGEGPERSGLERRVAERGLAENVRLIGETRGPLPLLAGCDLFCSPSWAESFPLSLLEAMWLDLPIVCTDVGGCREAVNDGQSGLLVGAGDSAALGAALRRLLDDRPLARSLGEAAGRRARTLFTSDRMVEGTLTVYCELADYHA